jgi:hypothetical protein
MWPLDQQGAAKALWAQLWATPQAVAWKRLGWTRVVARYARLLLEAEQPEASVARLGEVRRLEDRLGLAPMAMLRLRWEIAADEVAEQRQQAARATDDLRARLRRMAKEATISESTRAASRTLRPVPYRPSHGLPSRPLRLVP